MTSSAGGVVRLRRGGALELGRLGFGAAPLGNMNRALTAEESASVVEAAWASGARYFDTAPLYGHGLSEQRLGDHLRRRERNAFVLSTKVGRLLEPCAKGHENSGIYVNTPQMRVAFDYTYDGVMRSFEDSLRRLGVPIDILFVHDLDPVTHGDAAPAHWRDLMQGGWRALDELRRAGDVRALGAGMNECSPCERLLQEADPDVVLIAGRLTLLDQSALDALVPACATRGVAVIVGGVFNSGVLATGSGDGGRYAYAPASDHIRTRVRELERICADFDIRLADAALQFPLRFPGVTTILQGGQSAAEVTANAASLSTPIPGSLWEALSAHGVRTKAC